MTYTVVGREPDDPFVSPQLASAIRKHGMTSSMRIQRDVVILSVESLLQEQDCKMLSSRFGRRFDLFLLLNDVALEACRAVGFNLKPLGDIDETELSSKPSTTLTCPFWI